VSTNDWKAELRKRIQSIREKQAAEKARKQRVEAHRFPHGSAAPAILPVEEPEIENRDEVSAEELPPEPIPTEAVRLKKLLKQSKTGAESDVENSPQTTAEGAVKKAVSEEKEPEQEQMLFALDPLFTVEEEETTAAVGRERAQSEAAPAASDLDAELDSYTPLDHHPQQQSAGEIQTSAESLEEASADIPYVLNIRRLLAAVIDLLLIASVEVAFLATASWLLQVDTFQLLVNSLAPLGAMFLSLHFIYYTLFTAMTGQTAGKMLLRLRIYRQEQGLAIGILRATARWIAGAAALLPMAAGYLWMFSRADGKAWHDILLRMRVDNFRE
jgi:uncharacterized RDD family membrane protein YckC